MNHVTCIGKFTVVCVAMMVAVAGAAPLALHIGPIDPTTQGWNVFRGPFNSGPIYNSSGGIDAWQVEDPGGGFEGGYEVVIPDIELLDAQTNGFTFRAIVRTPNGNQPLNDAIIAGVNIDEEGYILRFGADNGTPTVDFLGVGGTAVTLTGLDDGFHLYEVVYDPGTSTADLFVDGVEEISDVAGWNGTFLNKVVSFGSGAGGGAGNGYYHLVQFDIAPAPPAATVTGADGGLVVSEDGLTDTFDLVLTSQPTDSVTVTINDTTDPNGGQISFSPNPVPFTTGDWSSPKTVTVSAVNDSDIEGLTFRIGSFDFSSTDPDFDSATGAFVVPVLVEVQDNDKPELVIVESSSSTEVSENGANDSYTVALNLQPTADVTVNLDDLGDPDQVTFSPTSLVFTNSNWADPQPVAVFAINDEVAEEDPHFTTIGHTSTSGDPLYEGLTLESVSVRIAENDCDVGGGNNAWGYNYFDTNQDCVVDVIDFSDFTLNWLACSTPNAPGCQQF